MISIEIDICEVFFNDVLLEKLLEKIAVWKQKLVKFLEMKKKEWEKTFKNCVLKKLNGDFMEKMHFVGFFSMCKR